MISNSGTSTLGLYDLKRKIDAFGGVDYFRPNLAGGYLKNARVMLDNGDIVKSTIDGNTNDPNVDMTGWVNDKEHQQQINNDLYNYKQPAIYAASLKTDGTDQLSELNALAAEAVAKKLELILPSGVITINDEFIPPSGLNMSSCIGFSGADTSNGTIIKWGAPTGANKAVIRCARKAIGITPTETEVDQINGVVIKGIKIDALNCDFGFYARYFTNESHADVFGDVSD